MIFKVVNQVVYGIWIGIEGFKAVSTLLEFRETCCGV